MLRKLRIQFVCFMMAIVTIMLCIIFVTIYGFTSHNLEHASLQKMQSVANRPGILTTDTPQTRGSYIIMQSTKPDIWVTTATGNFEDLQQAFFEEILAAALSCGEDSGVLHTYNLRFLLVSSPKHQTLIFADVTAELSAMQLLVRVELFIGGIGLLLFLAISILLAQVMVRPVERAWKQQTQFVADASHELKTPLTVIMTNAELLQDPDFSPSEKQRFSENVLTMSRQMRGLVNSLLELARVDNGAIKTVFSHVNLTETVQDAILPFDPLFFEKDLQMQSRIEPGIFVRGSVTHLRQVVEILLDNAMKYSQPGQVEIVLRRSGTHCLLTVTNPGKPIPAEELTHLFERFYRTDKSRSRDGSYGLGLSIAQRIVQEHHGKIWVESTGGKNRFLVLLPVIFRGGETGVHTNS